MIIDEESISAFLTCLGFKKKNGVENTYFKTYQKNYEVKILIDKEEFKNSKIDYGDKIKFGRQTTTNFSQQENFVILECINKLLDKGYLPDKIILEKDWKLGHKEKGCLDIQILDKSNNSFLMIECKTWDKEYKKEKNEIYDNGGQLFSYFIQDKQTKHLCLYSSVFDGEKILYENSIVKITEDIKKSTNQKEAFEKWKPQIFENRGIFEEDITPYNILFSGLRKKDLKELTREDGGDIFNRFAEILRRNVVSDKTNAYNKIFNLFLCKIVDEYEKDNDIEKLEFQWEHGENNETTLLRLNDLYKRGMKNYLNLDISAVTLEQIEEKLENIKSKKDKENLKALFIEQKLYTGNDFAFKEVFDKKTFDLNCIVVKEVVKLLEPYKIRYETKQQFLGDFFEKLLNTGIKQEVGQFFTPVPIAQFICKSLPLLEIIQKKNNNREINFLPYVIDYASGSGHFLTEIMEEINEYIEAKIDDSFIKGGMKAKNEFNSLKKNMLWSKEYIYGIEKDYRLAKTTKIATFLNGDGDATIICGDGLDNFVKSEDYKNRLKTSGDGVNNIQFDVVVANPPYSVSGFKTTLKYGKESFDLFDSFTDKSKEIECLFVERTKQLLNGDGVAGIILPSSILSNSGVYTRTREIILDNFEIKGIVELGANTFMATGTNTIILFLKRTENKKEGIINLIETGLKQNKDLTINNIEEPIDKYLSQTYKISFKDYLELLQNKSESLEGLAIISQYRKQFERQKKIKNFTEFLKNRELDRLAYFILTFNKPVVVSNIPKDVDEEREFLGYEFSNRRGSEGINIINLGGKLYNKNDLNDKSKVNYYILKNFREEDLEIHPSANSVKVVNLNEMLDFDSPDFDKVINLNKKKEIVWKESLDVNELNKRIEVKIGGTPARKIKRYFTGKNLWVSIEQMKGKEIKDTKEKITDEAIKNSNVKLIKKGTTLFSFKLSLGKTAIAGEDLYTNEAIAGLEIRPEFKEKILNKYLFYLFSSKLIKNVLTKNSNVFGTSLNKAFIEKIKIPFPSKVTQEKMIKEIESIENEKVSMININEEYEKKIENILSKASDSQKAKLGDVAEIIAGQSPDSEYFNYEGKGAPFYQGKIDFSDKYLLSPSVWTTKVTKKSVKGDILMSVRAPVGDVNINPFSEICIGRGLNAIRTLDSNILSQDYLWHILKRSKEHFLDISSGMTFKAIVKEDIESFRFPLPKNPIQRKIIKEINEIEEKINENEDKINLLEGKKEKVITSYLL